MSTRPTAPGLDARAPLDPIPEPASFALPDTPEPAPAEPERSHPLGPAGAIILVRHGEPSLSRRVKLDAAGYRRWWAAYEQGGILPDQSPPAALRALLARADAVFSSSRRRAVESARAAAGARTVPSDPMFVEAPLPPPPLPAFIKLSPRTWGLVARTSWWFLNLHAGEESRAQAERRAAAAAARLVAAASGGREAVLMAHGFFNAMIARELKRSGWRNLSGRGYRYWTARRFEKG